MTRTSRAASTTSRVTASNPLIARIRAICVSSRSSSLDVEAVGAQQVNARELVTLAAAQGLAVDRHEPLVQVGYPLGQDPSGQGGLKHLGRKGSQDGVEFAGAGSAVAYPIPGLAAEAQARSEVVVFEPPFGDGRPDCEHRRAWRWQPS